MTQSFDTPLPPPKERRRLREKGTLTQAQLAAQLGVSRETVRAWETGRSTPSGRKRESYGQLLASLAAEPSAEVTAPQKQEPPPKLTISLSKAEKPNPHTATPTATATATATHTPPPPPTTAPLTPAQAFDALYAFCAPALVRQAYLLTGRRELARESVEQAFQVAWQRWPEVAVDPDPASWVRAAAYEYALSPWHRFRPRYRHPEPPPADASDRALLDVLLTLPPSYRRTLLLYDGVGLGLPETAAETEASTRAAASRLLHARSAVAARLPDLAEPDVLHRRLAETASTERLRAAKPPTVRIGSERRARFWTRAAIAITVAIIGATALTLHSAPTRYEPPVPPGETVPGLPPRAAPGTLSTAELTLRAKLRAESANGPERLLPEPR
ncbi:helix-turn-helix domain-containing protein [Streptomyces phaeoluteigriseus]|uniref:Helix-turn-helix domain-containing protein n=1 Tax=Streptomyces phaeoluteigriseus TaxID=114686 RepID=A0ABY4Z2T4_9ACTN|nr:helix-turn-helix domain-containing protein [Streptomyces phaeoluteigriseus]USQ83074.1 helix-turn-helix domain-containing protein [Streptomyces phaeoluteigriseus]